MIYSVEDHIKELLFRHDCVIIPNFGGLVSNPVSSKINTASGTIFPPSKLIVFNKNLSINDGLLINHISKKEKISIDDSKNIVFDFSKKITNSLMTERSMRLNNIGLFTLGSEDNIIFHQDIANNFDLNSFGFESFQIQKKTITKKIIDINQSSTTKKISYKAAAVLIPLILLSLTNILLDTSTSNINIQKSDLNFFKKIKMPKLNVAENKIEKEIDKIETITTPKMKNYHVIAGAFIEKSNAEKLNNSLIESNFNSKILLSQNGYHRVSYNSFESKENAIIELEKLKRINKSAWILTN
ncbi:SPOR domain-containing protein [Bacteroidota bacterium]|nr:SPOR domain-containing protein [Bacteroidota bacterium]MDC3115139.1 SPOR domain-containing protein [Bacteroidota bacterium]MDC3230152.1 SPOR domain-containing protein [Bacteroidota bacterium]